MDIRHIAMKEAYHYRQPVWIVLDMLMGLRTFTQPHEEYLLGEPARYYPLAIVQPDGTSASYEG
jgi:hypothetical protein